MNPKKVLSSNLQFLLDRKGVTQTKMANDLGFPEMTVSNWMKEKTYPRIDRLQQMADFFGVYRSDITDNKEDGVKGIASSRYKYYPASISAGVPSLIDGITEKDVEEINLPDVIMGKYAGSENVFITNINGESMNNIMPSDATIAVKDIELRELSDGDIVVYSNDHEYGVKKYYKFDDEIVFRPDSDDMRFSETRLNINDTENLTIHGKVVLYIVETD